MVECDKCMYNSRHPFGMSFKEKTCLGCLTHDEKNKLSWNDQYSKLLELSQRKKINKYDCIIPVIGDAEDYFVTSEVLKLGLNPLIISVNSYFLNDIGWKNLHNLITYFDLDSWIYNPEIHTYKELIKTSMRKYNHMYLPWLQLHTSFPVHVAKEKKIPLIIWGGNQSIEQVGKFSHKDLVEMTSWSRTEHDLFGNDINELIGTGAEVFERNLNYYNYPEISRLGKNVKGIYLSNYIPWDSLKQNNSVLEFGFTPEDNSYSFDPYERAGSSVYYGVHDVLKYERLGYRKITDHLTREIRHGRINKNEALILQNHYEKKIVDIEPFFNWLGVSESGRKWFISHKIKNAKHLISDQPNEYRDTETHIIPKMIYDLVKKSSKSNNQFVFYGKGVEI